MTLDTSVRKAIYEGNGVKAPLPTVFVFYNTTEVFATHVDGSGVETPLVRDTDFSVTGGNGAAGEVEFPIDGSEYPILPAGEKIVIYRQLALLQELDVRNFNANDLELLEQAFDRIYMILQGHSEILSRCVQIQISSTEDPAEIVSQVYHAASVAAAAATAAATSKDAAETARDLARAAAATISLPDASGFTGGEILRFKDDLSGYEGVDTALIRNESATLDAGYFQNIETITDAATPTIDLTKSNHFKWALGANRTFPELTPTAAGRWLFHISGNYTLSFAAAYDVFGAVYDGSGANANYVYVTYDGTDLRAHVFSLKEAA